MNENVNPEKGGFSVVYKKDSTENVRKNNKEEIIDVLIFDILDDEEDTEED